MTYHTVTALSLFLSLPLHFDRFHLFLIYVCIYYVCVCVRSCSLFFLVRFSYLFQPLYLFHVWKTAADGNICIYLVTWNSHTIYILFTCLFEAFDENSLPVFIQFVLAAARFLHQILFRSHHVRMLLSEFRFSITFVAMTWRWEWWDERKRQGSWKRCQNKSSTKMKRILSLAGKTSLQSDSHCMELSSFFSLIFLA